MWGSEPPAASGSPDCPDLLQHVQALHSPATPLYLSFFKEECSAIAARLRLGAAAERSPGLGELSALQPELAGPATSTPLPSPSHGRVPDSSVGDCEAAAAPAPAGLSLTPREPRCLPQPAAGDGPGARPARSCAQSRRARRGPGTSARSPGRGCCRLSLPRVRASLGLQLPAAGTGRGAWETRLLRPPGTRLKLTSPARSRLRHASGVSPQAQPSSIPKPTPRDRGIKNNSAPASCPTRSRETPAVKVGNHKKPSSRLSTAIPTVASRSSLRPPGKVLLSKRVCLNKGLTSGSTTQELVCNRTQELKENGESKERLVAASNVLGAGKTDHTWVWVESSLSSKLGPGLTSGCEDAKQSAGDQLSQELERVKKELEQVKGELAVKTAQCKSYQQTISFLQAQLRAAGI
ncbi:NAC-alpha domain-containing protein 1-like [Sylvia atricapilla]|uniref:NAC-alpha domain-containing protein 1-like n=1 Tax=Sylvia atricapilla TaxID=48155 RepID=UPI0033988F34